MPFDVLPAGATAALVASGALTRVGVGPAFAVTTDGAPSNLGWTAIWGCWGPGLQLSIERSSDGGTTWFLSSGFDPDPWGFDLATAARRPLQAQYPAQAGTALYRLRLDPPFAGGTINYAVFQ